MDEISFYIKAELCGIIQYTEKMWRFQDFVKLCDLQKTLKIYYSNQTMLMFWRWVSKRRLSGRP